MAAQIHPPADYAGLKLRRPVAPVAQARQRGVQVGHKESHGPGVGAQRLLKAEMPRFLPELARLEQLQPAFARRVVIVSARLYPLRRVDD